MAEKKPAEGVQLDVKPTSQLDLERRLKAEEEGSTPVFFETKNPDESTLFGEDDSYRGTDPIYQNYANSTDKPLDAEKGADKLAEDAADSAFDTNKAGDQLTDAYKGVTTASNSDQSGSADSSSTDESDGTGTTQASA